MGTYELLTNGTTPDPMLTVTLWVCSECEQASLDDSWHDAWLAERERREESEWDIEDEGGPASSFGLEDRMVCPRCRYVHSDDETSFVDEHRVQIVPPPFIDSLA